MRKYKAARFLAWLVIAGGIGAALVFTVFGLFQLGSVFGVVYLGPALGVAFGGLLVALVGFGFLALFDIAEAVSSRRQNGV